MLNTEELLVLIQKDRLELPTKINHMWITNI